MIRKKVETNEPIIVDLTGDQGNAFVLLGMARKWAKDLNLNYAEIQKEATAGDYDHLLSVLDKYFGDFVIFER